MKTFLTKNEACEVLKRLEPGKELSHSDSVALTSIRVCIAAEGMGLFLWGKPVESARPIFRGCEIPQINSPEDVVENYRVYKTMLTDAYQKLSIEGKTEERKACEYNMRGR